MCDQKCLKETGYGSRPQTRQDEEYVQQGREGIPRLQCVPCAHAIHEPAKWVDKNFKRETAAEGAAEAVAVRTARQAGGGGGRRGCLVS